MNSTATNKRIPTNAERGTASSRATQGTAGTLHVVPPSPAPEQRVRKRATTQLQLPKGKPDLEALKAVIDDWLVPLLVKEFLAKYTAKAHSETEESAKPNVPHERRRKNANR